MFSSTCAKGEAGGGGATAASSAAMETFPLFRMLEFWVRKPFFNGRINGGFCRLFAALPLAGPA